MFCCLLESMWPCMCIIALILLYSILLQYQHWKHKYYNQSTKSTERSDGRVKRTQNKYQASMLLYTMSIQNQHWFVREKIIIKVQKLLKGLMYLWTWSCFKAFCNVNTENKRRENGSIESIRVDMTLEMYYCAIM